MQTGHSTSRDIDGRTLIVGDEQSKRGTSLQDKSEASRSKPLPIDSTGKLHLQAWAVFGDVLHWLDASLEGKVHAVVKGSAR